MSEIQEPLRTHRAHKAGIGYQPPLLPHRAKTIAIVSLVLIALTAACGGETTTSDPGSPPEQPADAVQLDDAEDGTDAPTPAAEPGSSTVQLPPGPDTAVWIEQPDGFVTLDPASGEITGSVPRSLLGFAPTLVGFSPATAWFTARAEPTAETSMLHAVTVDGDVRTVAEIEADRFVLTIAEIGGRLWRLDWIETSSAELIEIDPASGEQLTAVPFPDQIGRPQLSVTNEYIVTTNFTATGQTEIHRFAGATGEWTTGSDPIGDSWTFTDSDPADAAVWFVSAAGWRGFGFYRFDPNTMTGSDRFYITDYDGRNPDPDVSTPEDMLFTPGRAFVIDEEAVPTKLIEVDLNSGDIRALAELCQDCSGSLLGQADNRLLYTAISRETPAERAFAIIDLDSLTITELDLDGQPAHPYQRFGGFLR